MAQSQPQGQSPAPGPQGSQQGVKSDSPEIAASKPDGQKGIGDANSKSDAGGSGKENAENEGDGGSAKTVGDPVAMLTADHRRVEQLFVSFEKAADTSQKKELASQICTELTVHALLEEELFYPACADHMEKRLLEEAQVEHDGTKALILEVQLGSPDDEYFDAKVKVLSEMVKHHVAEEEKPREGILAKAKTAGVATADLAARLTERKQQLMEDAVEGDLGPPETRSFRVLNSHEINTRKENGMARGQSPTMDRDRDDRGRFVSDDDDDRDYRRRSSSRSGRDDDDNDRGSSRSRYDDDRGSRARSHDDDDDDRGRGRSMSSRDDEGRFTSSRSRSRDDDDDARGRGRGGWFGDPEGHSRASREGWDDRDSRSRSRADDDDYRGGRGRSMSSRNRDDDDRYSSRSRDDDDGRGHGRGGWFGDPEGHSRAAREGQDDRGRSRSRDDDDDDRGRSRSSTRGRDDEGRFTSSRSRDDDDDRGSRNRSSTRGRDDEGRFTSSRSRDDDDDRGSRSRSSTGGRDDDGRFTSSRSRDNDDDRGRSRSMPSRDDDGRFTSSRSRSRDDDDDDDRGRGRGSRGHGGWFGDSEGHAEAARRRR